MANGSKREVALQPEAGWAELSRDASHVLFVSPGNTQCPHGPASNLQVMDVSTGNLHQVLPDTCGLFSASWSPDGSQIAYSVMGDEQTKGDVLDVESRASRKLGGSTTLLEHVRSWSQDGSTILVDRCDCSGWESDSMPESAQLVSFPYPAGMRRSSPAAPTMCCPRAAERWPSMKTGCRWLRYPAARASRRWRMTGLAVQLA